MNENSLYLLTDDGAYGAILANAQGFDNIASAILRFKELIGRLCNCDFGETYRYDGGWILPEYTAKNIIANGYALGDTIISLEGNPDEHLFWEYVNSCNNKTANSGEVLSGDNLGDDTQGLIEAELAGFDGPFGF